MKMTLPTDSAKRKDYPMYTGLIKYFAAALAGVSNISKRGNDKHNPGEPMHHARGKSADHPDCVVRHVTDIADLEAAIERKREDEIVTTYDPKLVDAILEEANQMSWRSLAWNQELHERYGRAPLAPGARLPQETPAILVAAVLDHELRNTGRSVPDRGKSSYANDRLA